MPIALVLGLYLLLVPRPGFSHVSMRSVSNAFLIVNGRQLDYYIGIPPFISRLLGDGKDLKWYATYFGENLKVTSGGAPCPLTTIYPISPQPSGNQIAHIMFTCPRPITDLSVHDVGLFLDIDPTHTQFLKLVRAGNLHHVLADGILSSGQPYWHVANANVGNTAWTEWLGDAYQFFKLGVHHILTGPDHILFLLSVIVVAERFLETLKLVTAFTVAHSITLALAYFSIVSLPDKYVEPWIAVTIIYVAFENVWRLGNKQNFQRRWMLAFAFGLVHGLGFVYTLKRITVSKHELLAALVSFNLGIEGGQLIIVSIALVGLSWIKSKPWRPLFLKTTSLAIGGAGVVWLIARVYVLISPTVWWRSLVTFGFGHLSIT